MILRTIGLIFITLISYNCHERPTESPLATVVKLNSAELHAALKSAEEFIDVDRAYAQYANDTVTARQLWEAHAGFRRRLNSMNDKVTGEFLYYRYDIKETVEGEKATVTFKDRETGELKGEQYELEKRDGRWIVIRVVYIKNQAK